MNNRILIFDIETYVEIFLVVVYIPGEGYKQWEISKWKNEIDSFIEFTNTHEDHFWVGYNNLSFDSQIIEWILRNYHEWEQKGSLEITALISQKAQDRINDSNYDIFPEYREDQLSLKQIDLFTIWHFNNKNRMVSLKRLEFEMDLENIEESPVDFRKKSITSNDRIDIIKYCENDVFATWSFYLMTIGETDHPLYKGKNKILDRQIIHDEVGLNCLNWDDVRIGAEWNKLDYLSLSKRKENQLKPEKVNHFFGKKYKQFFPKTVSFQTKEVKLFIRNLGETFILNKPQNFPFKFNNGLIANLARGGIHSQEKPRRITPSIDEIYYQCDIGSQYPNAIRKYKVYPSHLGIEWNHMLVGKIERRLHYKSLYKETGDPKYGSLQEMGKLSLNGGAYGRLNLKGDWQEDPSAMLKITIGCQLEILMITEALILKGFNVVSLNTDGFDVIFPRERESEFMEICNFYEEKIGNSKLGQIEYTEFKWIVQTSVNDYIALSADGKLKFKGDFVKDFEMHKNKSNRIVPIALEQYFVNNIPIEETINNHTNIYDFAIRQKASNCFHYEGIDKKTNNKTIYNKLIRYYISKTGEKLLKVKNPDCQTNAVKIAQVDAGEWVSTVCNKLPKDHPMDNINRKYYIEKAMRIVDNINHEGRKYKAEDPNQLKLF